MTWAAGTRRAALTPLVPRGAPIAVVAPSHVHDPAKLERGLALARARGHVFDVFPGLLDPHLHLAAPDALRHAHLTRAFAGDYAAIWAVRGGSGMTRLLRRLDAEALAGPPKVVIGFSDVTALFAGLDALDRRHVAVHAPVLHSLAATDDASVDALFRLLDGEGPAPWTGEGWLAGEAAGEVVGGNLCLLAALCGTPWQLDVRDRILLLEEVGEAPYRIDRMLQQLLAAGGLDGVRAIGIGECDGCAAPPGVSWTLRDVLVDALGPLAVPVVGGLPFGHGRINHPFRWGSHGRLTSAGGAGRLEFGPAGGETA